MFLLSAGFPWKERTQQGLSYVPGKVRVGAGHYVGESGKTCGGSAPGCRARESVLTSGGNH